MLNTNTFTFSNYLKGQLVDFVDTYKKYFLKTLGITLALTIICFAGAALLQRFSAFDEQTLYKPASILGNFFRTYSNYDTYILVDLTKIILIFIISLFSIALTRLTGKQNENRKISFDNFISNIKFRDLCILFGMLCFVSFIDFALVKLDNILISQEFGRPKFIGYCIIILRIYLPLILFAFPINYLIKTLYVKLTLKRVVFLIMSVWLFNMFADELSSLIRKLFFGIILLPVEDQYRFYLFESILGIPLIALFFLGYHSAMTYPFKQEEENENDEFENIEV